MARIRTIKPEFFDSPGTARASHAARLLFIAMWCWADDWGVGAANPKALIGFAFPNDDDITASEFPTLRKEVADAFGVTFYEVDGRPYYCIPSWDRHQRTERKAKRQNPPPPSGVSPGNPGDSGTSDDSDGSSDDTHGSSGVGTGEQGNRGNTSCASDDAQRTDPLERFPAFWDVYGKKVDRKRAEQKWKAALKKRGVTPDLLIERAAAYVARQQAAGKHPEFTKNPDTWLNGENWNDETSNVTELRADRPRRNGLAFVPTCPTCGAPPENVHDPECPDQSWRPNTEGIGL